MSSSIVAWNRLIRFISASDGQTKFGEPILESGEANVAALAKEGKLEVNVFDGSDALSAKPSGSKDHVNTILGPFRPEDVPIIRCIGLNYTTHIKETGRAFPEVPTVSTKPAPTVTDHGSAVPIPKIAQEQADYEGELVILIGRDAYDVKAEDALDYVAGYTVGDDVSARDWQREANKAGVVPQWSFSKSFDKYAPMGPMLVSPKVLGAADQQELRNYVNGEERQQGNTNDLCHGVRALVAFCSQGQTLQKGSLIMAGTPGGVGLFMKPPTLLKDGDVVEFSISGIGKLQHSIKFMQI